MTPHNLFVTYDGVTKVVDFGIAKFSSRMSHTRAGTLKGKLAYMSPEQVHGEGIDRRTDIFALGVVLWELTTGQRLFRMESDLDTLAKVQECNVPRPSTLIRGYPVDLEKIVMKALAKNRGERFKTAREFSRALQSLLMRRGLFIASDEVAVYTQQIFQDRIQKREAHLRWAAEVTQTINVDQLLSKPKLNSGEFTGASEERSAAPGKPLPAAGGPPRPAAGMPPIPAAGAPAQGSGGWGSPAGQMPPANLPELPDDAKATAASLTTPRGPTGQAPKFGRQPPAAGRPATAPISAKLLDEPHPSDGDGPTIQGDVGNPYGGIGGVEPPTLMHISEADRPKSLRNPMASAQSLSGDMLEPELVEEGEDQTIVAKAQSRDAAAGPGPAAGRAVAPPPGPVPLPPRPNAQRIAALTGPIPGVPQGQSQPGFRPQQYQQNEHSYPGEQSNGGYPSSPMPPSQPQPSMGQLLGQNDNSYGGQPYEQHPQPMWGQQPMMGGPNDPYMQMHQTGIGNRGQPTVHRIPHDNRTMMAQRLKRRPPMWVVAALSCSVALLFAGIIIAIISTTSPSPKTAQNNPTGSAAPSTGAASSTASSVAGPFNQARTAFLAAAQPPAVVQPLPAPTTMAPPPVQPTATVAAAPDPTSRPSSRPLLRRSPSPLSPSRIPSSRSSSPPLRRRRLGGTGSLTVVCLPVKCDQIIDNGVALGPGHIFSRPVPAGRHTLQLSAPNGVKKSMTFEVLPDQLKDIRVPMSN